MEIISLVTYNALEKMTEDNISKVFLKSLYLSLTGSKEPTLFKNIKKGVAPKLNDFDKIDREFIEEYIMTTNKTLWDVRQAVIKK